MADYASVGQSAAQSAEQAAASASSASGSAATATQAAQTATTKASDAIIAEGVATAKAEDAQAYATSANQSAESASTSAQTATTAAATATAKASEASESATTATAAKTDAESARDAAAQSASQAAESARTLTIDATLTQSGQAADAKKAGDEITGLKEDLEYLNENIANHAEITAVEYVSGGISGTGQIQADSRRIRVKLASMPIMHSGDIIEIGGVFEGRIFGNNTQGYADLNIVTGNEWLNGRFVIPENEDGKYFGILLRVIGHETEDVTSYVETVSDYVKYYNVETVKSIANEAVRFTEQELTDGEKNAARENIGAVSINSVITDKKVVEYTGTNGKFWDFSSGTTAEWKDGVTSWRGYSAIKVNPGEEYQIRSCQGLSHKVRIWIVVDASYNILSTAQDYYDSGYSVVEDIFTIPEHGAFLLCTIYTAGGNIRAMELYKKINMLSDIFHPLAGKRLSLLGDSISAYAGTIPEGNDAYYTGNNSGVSSPEQMWWKVLCDKTGMIPLVINAWSGSGINWQTDSAHINKVPMSDDSRCSNLGTENETPDVILITGGTNDYTYAQTAQNEPLDWDGSVPGYTEPTAGKIVYNTFTEAYVATIKKLQTNYPNAIVVACSTWFTMRGTDNGYILTHAVGQNVYTQKDYDDKIRYVAGQMRIPFLDVCNIGFNRNNFYPKYAQDSSTIPTHTNAAGQKVMGEAVAEKLVALVKGFLT
jgi:lysophospholipase L1-like esterase